MPDKKPEYEEIYFHSQKEFEDWLHREHEKTTGVWVKMAKKASGEESITFAEALEVALCYGWIDGQSDSLGDTYFRQKFTPRGKKSTWSKKNREHIARLSKEKRMQAAGLAAVAAAKADGRWESAYDSPSTMVIPDDFLKLLAKDKKAEAFFKTLNKTNTYAIGWRLQTAKKPETRERRMQVILQMLHNEEKFH